MTAPQWPGTPAEWDAELERRACAIQNESDFTLGDDAVVRWARATMPPRPVEPPSVVTGLGWSVEWDGTFFSARQLPKEHQALHDRRAHTVAAYVGATNAEYDAIRALRDGPTARYEVCGWEAWKDGRMIQCARVDINTEAECERVTKATANTFGGTAHAIYKRVGGEG